MEAGVAAGSGSDTIDGTIPGGVEGPVRIEETAATPEAPPKSTEEENATAAGEDQFPVFGDDEENASEQLLKIKIEEDGRVKKYKKTLRLSTEAVVSGTDNVERI